MKFRADKTVLNLYGYDFKKGEVVDVIEQNLIKKFKQYPFLKGVRNGNKGRSKKPSTTDVGSIEDRTSGKE